MSSLNKISLNGTVYDIGIPGVHYVDMNTVNELVLEDCEPGVYVFSTGVPQIKAASTNDDTWSNPLADGMIFYFTKWESSTPTLTPLFYYRNKESGQMSIVGKNSSGSGSGLTNLGEVQNTSVNVLTTGSQTISGTKTFSAIPQCAVTPSSNNDLVNKKYVDDMDSGFIGSPNVYAIEKVTAYPATEEPGHLYIKV